MGTSSRLPETTAADFAGVWREKVFALLRDAGCINGRIVFLMRRWTHSGFSVDRSVRLHGSDRVAVERILQYMARCPFSLERIVRVTPEGQVVYRTENGECRPFVFEGRSDRKPPTVSRDFQVFAPLDFLAEITQHIPGPGEHLVRYYGWCSNKRRGLRRRQTAGAAADPIAAGPPEPQPPAAAPGIVRARARAQRWAELIRRVYEVDPLRCPRCGGQMRIVAFLEPRDQAAAIARIPRHCGLWTDPPPRPAPAAKAYPDAPRPELLYVAEEGGVYHVPGV